MSKPVQTIDLHSSYEEACEKMVEHEMHTIPVTKEGKIIGILDLAYIFRDHNGGKNEH